MLLLFLYASVFELALDLNHDSHIIQDMVNALHHLWRWLRRHQCVVQSPPVNAEAQLLWRLVMVDRHDRRNRDRHGQTRAGAKCWSGWPVRYTGERLKHNWPT